ncbi:CDP-diacylglycerol--glycerol-3-phosphate 3-phosphatidyltransferase [Paenibacillus sp. FSL K6-0276]|uniref:CDP-diacylglycerol--glycerol-3-phosphate 3-phosphatidyltransferase n=1 Tax=Paenibacillus sp. FSL K6-0276 TaxID=2921450 RepID=UPI0030ED188C
MNLANKVTIARILLIPIFILLFSKYPDWPDGIYYAAIVFILASVTDKLDGYIARKYNQITNLGKLLDPLADKLLISAALILLVSQHRLYAWVALVIVAREVIITGIRLVAVSQKIVLQADRYGKIKMVSQVVAITVVMLDNHPFAFITNIPIDQILIYFALIITVYSGFNYIKNNYHSLKIES